MGLLTRSRDVRKGNYKMGCKGKVPSLTSPTTSSVWYRDLRAYKYQTVRPFEIEVPWLAGLHIITDFVKVTDGKLRVEARYAWDGPSGPTIDTDSSLRASLPHDALYGLMRAGLLDAETYRPLADKLLYEMCREDGMGVIRAGTWYRAVRMFAGGAARNSGEPEPQTIIKASPNARGTP